MAMTINLGPFARIVGHNLGGKRMDKIATVTLENNFMTRMVFGDGGNKLYAVISKPVSGLRIQEYTLSTPWMIESMALTKEVVTSGTFTGADKVFIPPPGNTAFLFKHYQSRVQACPLSLPGDLTSVPSNWAYSTEFTLPKANSLTCMSSDGLRIFYLYRPFAVGQLYNGFYQTILSSPWDFGNISWRGWSYTFQSLPGFSAIAFSPDGTSLFGLEEKSDRVVIHRYSLLPWGSTDPWNLLNAIKLVGSYEVSPVRGSPVGLLVSDDGRYVYAFVTFAETSTITQFKV